MAVRILTAIIVLSVGSGVPVPAPPIAHPRTMLDAVGTFEKVFP
jgi:hypothetical protein